MRRSSIIFLAAWALLTPLLVWRFAVRRTRIAVLIRPAVVIVIRIATFVIRALEANGNYATSLFITEQVSRLVLSRASSSDPRPRRSSC